MIYFDYAGLGIPREDALKQEYEYKLAMARDPSLEFKYFDRIERNKELISKSIFGTSNYMVSYVRNTTEGMTIASNVVPIDKDEEIVISNLEHRSTVNSWQYICEKRHAVLRIVDINYSDTAASILCKFKAAITKNTKVICCSHIDRNFGLVFPITELSELANKQNAYMIIDGAQAVGLIPINMDKIKCSIYICSFHKWCRMPVALGVMLTNKSITHKLERLYVGEKRLTEERPEDKDFGSDELGTRNVALEMCLPMIIDNEEDDYTTKNVCQFISRIKQMTKFVEVVSELNVDGRGFVVINIVTSNCADMKEAFWRDYGILVGRIHVNNKHYIRVSFDRETTESDFNILIEALKDYARYSISK